MGGYSPGFRDGLAAAAGAPFEGTSEAIPAAAETGLEFVVLLLADSFAPPVPPPLVAVFTRVLVPAETVCGPLHERERFEEK